MSSAEVSSKQTKNDLTVACFHSEYNKFLHRVKFESILYSEKDLIQLNNKTSDNKKLDPKLNGKTSESELSDVCDSSSDESESSNESDALGTEKDFTYDRHKLEKKHKELAKLKEDLLPLGYLLPLHLFRCNNLRREKLRQEIAKESLGNNPSKNIESSSDSESSSDALGTEKDFTHDRHKLEKKHKELPLGYQFFPCNNLRREKLREVMYKIGAKELLGNKIKQINPTINNKSEVTQPRNKLSDKYLTVFNNVKRREKLRKEIVEIRAKELGNNIKVNNSPKTSDASDNSSSDSASESSDVDEESLIKSLTESGSDINVAIANKLKKDRKVTQELEATMEILDGLVNGNIKPKELFGCDNNTKNRITGCDNPTKNNLVDEWNHKQMKWQLEKENIMHGCDNNSKNRIAGNKSLKTGKFNYCLEGFKSKKEKQLESDKLFTYPTLVDKRPVVDLHLLTLFHGNINNKTLDPKLNGTDELNDEDTLESDIKNNEKI